MSSSLRQNCNWSLPVLTVTEADDDDFMSVGSFCSGSPVTSCLNVNGIEEDRQSWISISSSNSRELTLPKRMPGNSEDSLQFFKEEKSDGAVYHHYLKKVRYHTASEDVGILPGAGEGNSTFYRNFGGGEDPDDGKARLQWRMEEIQIIKCGTPRRLVEAVAMANGEMDSTYVNILLATYRSFSTACEMITLFLERYHAVSEDVKMKQQVREAHCKTIRTVISVWLDNYPEDFHEPPNYSSLRHLSTFAARHIPDSDLGQRARERIHKYTADEDATSTGISVDDINVEIQLDLCGHVDLMAEGLLMRPLDFMRIPTKIFAAQLTYIDSELFKKVSPHQCLGCIWSRRGKKRSLTSTVFATINQFNAVSYRTIATILKHPDLPPDDRVEIIEKWIEIAQELRVLKNFSSLKAIISGLRSNPVYRLTRVWLLVDREKAELFEELSEIFSEDNNHVMQRELLNKEGTAKFADPESYNTIRGHKRNNSGWGTLRGRRATNFNVPDVVQGTVPYLGTFLTDLTMIDTAIPTLNEDSLVNFEKKRKEFEVLAQIRLLQSAATLYKIQPIQTFFEWFHSIRVYDENESYELSCEIELVSNNTPQDVKGHRKKSSLGFFTPRRLPSMDNLSLGGSSIHGEDIPSPSSTYSNTNSLTPTTNEKPVMGHSISAASLKSMDSTESTLSSWKSPESCVVKIYLDISDGIPTNHYKSIMLSNSDHTRHVLDNVFTKYELNGTPQDYVLFQAHPHKEFQIPEKGNVFYAIDTTVPEVKFIVRKRADLDKLKSRHLKGKGKRKNITI